MLLSKIQMPFTPPLSTFTNRNYQFGRFYVLKVNTPYIINSVLETAAWKGKGS